MLFDSASTFIGLSSVLGSLISSVMIEIDRQTKRLDAERQRLHENEARVAGELAAARRIQQGALPDAAQPFAGETRFSVAAWLDPADDVGGDLYDFFMVGPQRLCFFVGEVSGKGVPASLFMATTRTLVRSLAQHVGANPEQVARMANRELARENAQSLFVTLLLGVLDIDSGELRLVVAGHDVPWRIAKSGEPWQMDWPPEMVGPPLCQVDDYAYRTLTLSLEAGDMLCLVSDGIVEATNMWHEVYGHPRLSNVLRSAGPAGHPGDLVDRVREDVAAFAQGVAVSDDRVMLVLQWNGPS